MWPFARKPSKPKGPIPPPSPQALNPRQVSGGATEWDKTFDLPPDVLRFGYYPDVTKLLPGDLILTCDMNPHWTSRLIAHFQKTLCASPQWTHAAMYMGGKGQIVESTFESFFDRSNGVKVGLLSDYFQTHYILIRRLPNSAVYSKDPNDSIKCMDARWQLVVSAMKHMRRPYGFFQLRKFIGKSFAVIKIYTRPSKLVCSTLYEAAAVDAVGKVLCGGGTASPGMLAETVDLDTVSISWVKIRTKDM
jgi:hypothetical protein